MGPTAAYYTISPYFGPLAAGTLVLLAFSVFFLLLYVRYRDPGIGIIGASIIFWVAFYSCESLGLIRRPNEVYGPWWAGALLEVGAIGRAIGLAIFLNPALGWRRPLVIAALIPQVALLSFGPLQIDVPRLWGNVMLHSSSLILSAMVWRERHQGPRDGLIILSACLLFNPLVFVLLLVTTIDIVFLRYAGVFGLVLVAMSLLFVCMQRRQIRLEAELARRQQAEDALQEANRDLERRVEERTREVDAGRLLLQVILDSCPTLIAVRDLDGRYRVHNRAYADVYGSGRASLVGLAAYDVMSAIDADLARRVDAMDADVLRDGITRNMDGELVKDGRVRHFKFEKFVIRDAAGRINGIGAAGTDITDLVAARQAAEDATEAKSQFLATMSHEIRTPMNAILGMTRLALGTDLQPRQRDYVDKAHRAAGTMLRLVNDVLDLSKIEAGHMELDRTAFSMSGLMLDLANLVALEAEAKSIELVFDIDPGAPEAIVGDPLRLSQVLVNLTRNAVKFTSAGEVVVSVRESGRSGGRSRMMFSVADTGIGISGDQLQRLFTPYGQGDQSTARRYGGSGLGLVISRHLVELMGGQIDVHSEQGKGSRFSFELEFDPAEGPRPAEVPAEMVGRRLLLVHPAATARRVLRELGGSLDLEVRSCADVDEARSVASRGFDLVLADWGRLGPDAAALAPAIAGRDGRLAAHIAIVAFGEDRSLDALTRVGVTPAASVSRPVMRTSLLQACSVALGLTEAPSAQVVHGLDELVQIYGPALRGRRVLLVEDNDFNREIATLFLEKAGLVVDCVEDGRQALHWLHDHQPDVVLMDCQMPVMDGYDATRAIRAYPHRSSLPIIAMTADAFSGDRTQAIESGMNDHVPKPIDVAVLYATLQRWLHPGGAVASAPAGS